MLSSGTLLHNNRYQIISLLGQGGMGSVYRALDQTMNRAVAIKERAPAPNVSPQVLAQVRLQFQREVQILGTFSHPNLPHVYDFFSASGNEYVAMELIEGESLEQIIRRAGAINEGAVRAWARQVLDALICIHSYNVIHRDVKPANIILKPTDGRIVLVDFGLVKLMDPNNPYTLPAVRGMGTIEYAPYEQYGTGNAHTDARSDIYALGATLYHLLTGRAPVPASERLLDPAALPPPRTINPRITSATEQFILKAMELNSQSRFQTAAEMKQVLLSLIVSPPQVPVTMPAAPMPTQQIVTAYCVKERQKRQMKDAKRVTLKNGRPAMRGVCSVCGTKMFKFIKK